MIRTNNLEAGYIQNEHAEIQSSAIESIYTLYLYIFEANAQHSVSITVPTVLRTHSFRVYLGLYYAPNINIRG